MSSIPDLFDMNSESEWNMEKAIQFAMRDVAVNYKDCIQWFINNYEEDIRMNIQLKIDAQYYDFLYDRVALLKARDRELKINSVLENNE